MIIGVPKEIKKGEHRVGLVPSAVMELTHAGHEVIIQSTAGDGIGVHDPEYVVAGAHIVETPEEVFAMANMIVKVKEPQPVETMLLREHHVLFTYLHLAPDPIQTKGLIESGCTAIAYETVTDNQGALPLLTPMSEVAGRLSIQAGARCLEKNQGGRGVLLGGVPGVGRGHVVIIGGGVVGTNAMRMAIGSEARITVLDRSLKRLRELDEYYGSKIKTVYASEATIEHSIIDADLVVCAVLLHGAAAPKLITREHLKKMHDGSVVVDVSIDQGGCMETSRPTTHADPTFIEEGVVHYCVANMPGAVPRTATFALNNATFPFVKRIADIGAKEAMLTDVHLLNGLNVHRGKVTYEAVARDLDLNFYPGHEALLEN